MGSRSSERKDGERGGEREGNDASVQTHQLETVLLVLGCCGEDLTVRVELEGGERGGDVGEGFEEFRGLEDRVGGFRVGRVEVRGGGGRRVGGVEVYDSGGRTAKWQRNDRGEV